MNKIQCITYLSPEFHGGEGRALLNKQGIVEIPPTGYSFIRGYTKVEAIKFGLTSNYIKGVRLENLEA